MILALKAVSGPLKDEVFPLSEGLTVGRQGAGIALDDPKISSIHARVVKKGADWYLEDNNSKNGIRVGGEKIERLKLAADVRFYLGNSEFTVFEIKPKEKPAPGKKQRYWYEVLADFAESETKQTKDNPRPLSALEPALVLDFVRGTQTHCRWTLGFGPRKIGAASVDLPIWEPGAPAVCFEILPSSDGLLFKTAHPEVVRLNGEAVDSRVLRMGDRIHILDTLIEVDFAE